MWYRASAAALALALSAAATAAPAWAQEIDTVPVGTFAEVVLEPAPGTTIEYRGRSYSGTLVIRAAGDGLSVIESTDLDGYLQGVREVPFSWPEEALAAQAVAARSYLAATLSGGRRGAAATYGFDICASTACQVYAGAGNIAAPNGSRWVDAVARTSGEILIYNDRPATTYYHSTSGGRTEAVQDIWVGSTPLPYLQGADSPGESSPFTEWRVSMSASGFLNALRRDGVELGGTELTAVRLLQRPSGDGIWQLAVVTDEDRVALDVGYVRSALNREGPRVLPGVLPGVRPDGRRYPQTILSYRYDVSVERSRAPIAAKPVAARLPASDLPPDVSVVFRGRGWGHHVGMSQYGAEAMASAGAAYPEILAHYYGGLLPESGAGRLPAQVAVGLSWADETVSVRGGGTFRLIADGRELLPAASGSWQLRATQDGRIAVAVPFSRLVAVLAALRTGPRFL